MTRKLTENFNWNLFFPIMAIVVIGMINLYSAVYYWGEGRTLSLFWSQLLWMIIGLIVMILVSFIDYKMFNRFALVFYGISIFLLLLSLILGKEIHGTQGWLKLGFISIQPAEFAKLAYLFVAARYFTNNPNPDGYGFVELIVPMLTMALPCGLIVLQGDLGSSIFFVLIFCCVIFFAGVRTKTLIVMVIAALIAVPIVYSYGLKDYQKQRITTFINPEVDVRGTGYHLMQSKIAVGSGKIFGKGYLKGNINKLRYLPERHTDFIFPVFAEEWGFLGSIVLLALYYALLMMALEIARKSKERFANFMAVGVAMMIFCQLFINLGGVLGIIPLTGVTLPLLSYGGSSMIVILASLGILFNISKKRFMF